MFIGDQYNYEYLHQGKLKDFLQKVHNISDAIIHTTDPNMETVKKIQQWRALRNHYKLARYSLDVCIWLICFW